MTLTLLSCLNSGIFAMLLPTRTLSLPFFHSTFSSETQLSFSGADEATATTQTIQSVDSCAHCAAADGAVKPTRKAITRAWSSHSIAEAQKVGM